MSRKQLLFTSAALVILALLMFFFFRPSGAPAHPYRTFLSPDGRFEILVYRSRQWFGAMPGQAGDAPGSICLLQVASGRILERKHVEMVQLVDQVAWSPTNVEVKLIAD